MKTRIPAVLICLFFFNTVIAQTIPNAGFETWINSGNYENPQDWGTLNQQTALIGIKTVVKATTSDAHSGSYAIKLISKFIGTPFNQFVPGLAATGTINQTTKNIDGGFPYNLRPISLTGWYKYFPGAKDTASVEVIFSKWNSATGKRIRIGAAKFMKADSIANYTKFTVDINYISSDVPDTCMIILLSSRQNSGVVNSTLFIDDLSFDLTNGIHQSSTSEEITVYPNPSSGTLFISNSAFGARLIIYDLKGEKLIELPLQNDKPQDLPMKTNGMYFYQIQDQKGKLLKNGKLIINN